MFKMSATAMAKLSNCYFSGPPLPFNLHLNKSERQSRWNFTEIFLHSVPTFTHCQQVTIFAFNVFDLGAWLRCVFVVVLVVEPDRFHNRLGNDHAFDIIHLIINEYMDR
mmetsp:Transcript_17497/g.27938  ORF Transcript_17497/g.27938 Transcript_17497/m.27938 type:complete len:109 (-) Transcript_17497:344-670(-)